MTNHDEIVCKIIQALVDADPAEFSDEDSGGPERAEALANKIADALVGTAEEEGRLRVIINETVAAALVDFNSAISKARRSTRGLSGF